MEEQPLYQANYAQSQENQFILKPIKNNISSNILLILAQILVWACFIYTLFSTDFLPYFLIVYFLYVIIELCSHTSNFLLNKKSTNSIYHKLKELFSSAPVLQLNISCYHYETRIEERRTQEGKIIQQEVTERVDTFRDRKDFIYYSFRDVSGLFKVDLDNEIFKNKTYIKLTLDTMISFADSISYYDYQNFKNYFLNENKDRDERYDFNEKFYINNLSKNNLIRIKDEEPFYINFFFFLICTLFTMALPYEILLDNISIEGKYQIKKIISTRYNLNDYEYDGVYGYSIPSIKLGENTYNFNSDDYGYYNQNAEVNLPTLEEIEKAKQYEDDIKRPIYDDHLMDDNNNMDLPTQEEINYQNRRKNQ